VIPLSSAWLTSQVALYLACASTCACDAARIARSISAWILGFLSMAHMINADVAAEIDVRQLAAITGIGRDGRAPAR
jgi:hypothetical protein